MAHLYRTNEETRQAILKIVTDSEHPLTRRDITDALGRAKSPHLLELIETLVDEGWLERSVVAYHNGVQGYVYTPNQEGGMR